MPVAVKITGVKKLIKNFKASERDVNNFTRGATHKVATVVTKRAKQNAPKDLGRLKKSTSTKRRRPRGNKMFKSDTIIKRNAGSLSEFGKGVGAPYWHHVEYGTVKQAPQPFVGPALERTRPEAPAIFRADVLKRTIKAMEKRALR